MAARSEVPDTDGLSQAEVAERVEAGRTNAVPTSTSRTASTILRANVLTRFNAILGSLFVVALVVGPPQDALFGIVLVLNTAMGIAQEWRAKVTLDRLALLHAAAAHAVRDGEAVDIAPGEVVIDDVLELRAGDQVVADASLLSEVGLEIDEALLTGESVPVAKQSGDDVLSGSIVVAGSGRARVVRVGTDSFAQRMQGDARRFSLVRSELQQGTNRLLRLITWVLVPTAVLLTWSQIARVGLDLGDALRGCIAGVGAMVPEGLVLLTTIAFALGALRLAGRRVLVQELAAIEGLARVDVLCIDKTGTLTDSTIVLEEVVALEGAPARDVLGAMAAADPAPNATMRAIASLPDPGGWVPTGLVPFTSAGKWSAASFAGRGTWVLGAPDVVVPHADPHLTAQIAESTASGRRVVLLGRATGSSVSEGRPDETGGGPPAAEPAALVVLRERVRDDVAATLAYLVDQGVEVKVLSGDDPATVGAVGRAVGLAGSEAPVDARTLPEAGAALADAIEASSVFGRVRPEQKRAVVEALQAKGHVVAMTGDGVNDVPSVKASDLGVAMGSGSPAARAVARVVLLDDSFAVVPRILEEGRRVIANVQRVANLFVTKSVYAALLAVVVAIAAVPYPFFPRHLTIVSTLTIGLPGFFLAIAPGAPRARPGFLRRVLTFTVPSGVVAAAVTLLTYLVARGPCHANPTETRTATTIVLLLVGLGVLGIVARPLTPARGALVVAMGAIAAFGWFVPGIRSLFGLETPPVAAVAAAIAAALAGLALLVPVLAFLGRREAQRGTVGLGLRTSGPGPERLEGHTMEA